MRQALRHVVGGAVDRAVSLRHLCGPRPARPRRSTEPSRLERRRAAGRRRHRDADRDQLPRSAVTDAERKLRSYQPAASGRIACRRRSPASARSSNRHRAAGQRQPRDRDRDGARRARRDGVGGGGDAAGRDPQSRRSAQVIENERIEELPLNGRNADRPDRAGGRGGAAAGAQRHQPQHAGRPRRLRWPADRPFGVAYLLDGATHNNPYDNLNLPLPFPDALQEFRVETSSHERERTACTRAPRSTR